jgi:hypothetical protein
LGTSAIGTELQLMPPTVSSGHRRASILAQKISDNPGRSGYRQVLRIAGPIDQVSPWPNAVSSNFKPLASSFKSSRTGHTRINRYSWRREIAVTHRKQSGTLKSIATECAVFRNREEEAIDRTVTIRE